MIDFDQVKADAVGRWPGIFQTLGVDVGQGKHGPCPHCGGKDRYRFDDIDGTGSGICGQCGAGDGWVWVQKILGVDFKEACSEVSKIVGTIEQSKYQAEKPPSPEALRKLYKESHPVKADDAVSKYLRARGLNSMPKSLRYSTKVWESETKKEQRAMLATFQLPDGEAVTIHRTYIDGKGHKLDIQSPKKMFPTLKKMTGGAVRLYQYTSGILGIAEGIETAIAVHENFNLPIWACLSSGLMESFEPPKDVTHICIFADNDKNYTGQKAAYILANRLAVKNHIIPSVEIPDEPGEDFLDNINRVNSGG